MNKDNAKDYLPLVQALAEGKTIQEYRRPAYSIWGWVDDPNPTFTAPPTHYRIKPLSHALPPWAKDESVLHNPDKLTPEQVGDGYRLPLTTEIPLKLGTFNPSVHRWTSGAWDTTGWTGDSKLCTYRLPASVPWPDEPKPEPKFKVGDRVRASGKLTDSIAAIQQGMYLLKGGGWFQESQLEPYVWSLSRHLPGFRALRDGEEWHRTYFTEDMLPEGWRPLLKDEPLQKGDSVRSPSFKQWGPPAGMLGQKPMSWPQSKEHYRTSRPLPESPKMVPLEASDVPPGSYIKQRSNPYWSSVITVNPHGVVSAPFGFGLELTTAPFQLLFTEGWLILRPGSTTWQKCEKEAQL